MNNSSNLDPYRESLLELSHTEEGALVVVLDMSLAILSVVSNIVIITAIRDQEELLCSTSSLILANLSASNLISAVLVKSISVVHNGYAVASNTVQSNIAFCLLYCFTSRLTWAILPFTIVALSWLSLGNRINILKVK